VYKSRHTHTDNMNNNYSTVSYNIYSSRGPVGRPLYPQLSGHCNRPFPRDSRVFTRRLTPNLECSHSHTKSTSKSYQRSITRHDDYQSTNDTTQEEQLYKVTRHTGVYIG